MIKYEDIKSKVYIETTVVSYLAARPSTDATLGVRQRITRQFWENYSDNFEFIVSDVVITEIRQGDEIAAQRRIEALAGLTVLELSPEAVILALELINAGAVPPHSLPDAQHIAIAVVNGIEYLTSWNYKHIVSETKRQHIDQVCRAAGYQPTILCTPVELIEEMHVKEKEHPPMDPILEECYKMKEEFAARFKTMQELVDYLKAENIKNKAEGWKYVSFPPVKCDKQD
ncbi:MAG: type II toxin-antitoxin system VapC family toxin [Candidatus Poribacteria bacterium]|nr:type II toxin-antitoxin system VapC family toxin [Candidatus Poribacteria bacterium]